MNALIDNAIRHATLFSALTISEWALVTVAVVAVILVILAVGAWNWITTKRRLEREAELTAFLSSVQKSLRWIIKHSNTRDRETREMVREVAQQMSELFHRENHETREIIRDVRHSIAVNVSQTDVKGDRLNIGRVGDGNGESKAEQQ